jgi:uncharacterized protein YbjT (DUF2867 family)
LATILVLTNEAVEVRVGVAGGTGTVGHYVVDNLKGAGHDVVVISRASGVDLRQGDALAEALLGVEVIIDVSNPKTTNGAQARAFFVDVTQRLHDVGAAAGVQRLVSLSIVGINNFPFGYYQAKLAQEAAVFSGSLLSTVVRATQFHEFAAQILVRTRRGPIAGMPIMRIQPIAARSVAEVLVSTALLSPSEKTVEIAGPHEESLVAMARSILRDRGGHALVIPLRVPGAAGKMMRSGGQLPPESVRLLGPTFAQWLGNADSKLPRL